jgi:single-strand DNA-binding protein
MNNVAMVGNVVKDPTSRSTPTGKSVSTLRLAVNNPLNDKEVLYIDVDSWDKQAEFVGKHVKKGSLVSVVGRMKMDEWEKNCIKQTKYLIVADRVNFVGGKKKDATSDNTSSDPQSDEFDDAAFAAAAGIK